MAPLKLRSPTATHPEGSVVMVKDLNENLKAGAAHNPDLNTVPPTPAPFYQDPTHPQTHPRTSNPGMIISPRPGGEQDFTDLKQVGFAVDLDDYYGAELRQMTVMRTMDMVANVWKKKFKDPPKVEEITEEMSKD